MIFKKSAPKWVREYQITLDRNALTHLFDKYGAAIFNKDVAMVYVLYDVDEGLTADTIKEKLLKDGWSVEALPQAPPSSKLVIEAKSASYRITEENYKRDTVAFRRLAEMYHAGYDGWYIVQSNQ